MGAADFYAVGIGADLMTAFTDAAERARFEHGHGGYTGTIAEKWSVKRIGPAPDLKTALDIARKMINDDDPRTGDKWGPAGALGPFPHRVRWRGGVLKAGEKAPEHEDVTAWLFFGMASE